MGKSLPPFCRVIEQEWRGWAPFRRALSNKDQKAFDRTFAGAQQPLRAEVRLGRPWRLEAVLMAGLLEQEKRIETLLRDIEALTTAHRNRSLADAKRIEEGVWPTSLSLFKPQVGLSGSSWYPPARP